MPKLLPPVKAKRGRGRPDKLTPERAEQIIEAIRKGNYLEPACVGAGISYKVFREWMIRGEKETSGKYRDFREGVLAAEADSELRAVASIESMIPRPRPLIVNGAILYDKDGKMIETVFGDWKAAAHLLAHRHPDRWADRERLTLTGPGDGPIQVQGVDLTTAEKDLTHASKMVALVKERRDRHKSNANGATQNERPTS